jgi:ectoine hydroxylase-related dioxygenase (phytanoyl-CoA dioxygenase family)
MMSGGTEFERFHAERLPAEIAARDGGRAAAEDVGDGRALALRLVDGAGSPLAAFTYRSGGGAVSIDAGTSGATTIVELDADAFDDLAAERCTIFGLLYPGRLRVVHGSFEQLAAWEAALTNLWFDRPIYRGENAALHGLDLQRSFVLSDSDDEIRHFLRTAGFVVLRDVFSAGEIARFDAEANRLRSAATVDDNRSWWATNGGGAEVCCRLTYVSQRSADFAELHDDPRLQRIAAWHGAPLRPSPDRLDGHSIVIKNGDVVSGLSDLPWHRDCGLGGHPVLCPSLLVGIQLDDANARNGQLVFLAGSHRHTNRIDEVDRHPDWPVVPIEGRPGDVTVHYSHVLHAAPPPTSAEASRRTLYVSFNNPAVFDVVPPGHGYNDVVFSHGDGRVKAPAEIA